jgi:hypothetical protein
LHASQLLLHGLLQHTPSAQNPLWQSVEAAQAEPSGRGVPPLELVTTVFPPAPGPLVDAPPLPSSSKSSV